MFLAFLISKLAQFATRAKLKSRPGKRLSCSGIEKSGTGFRKDGPAGRHRTQKRGDPRGHPGSEPFAFAFSAAIHSSFIILSVLLQSPPDQIPLR